MRLRTRKIPAQQPTVLLAQTRPVMGGGEITYSSVDARLPVPLVDQRFIDAEVRRGNVATECFNIRKQYYVHGFLPDFGSSGEERNTPYVTYGTESTGRNTSVPTAHVITRAAAVLPIVQSDPDWRRAAKAAGHQYWIKDGWRKPRLTLYNGFSLPNFLLEWKQMVGLCRSWSNRDELIARYHKTMGRNARLGTRLQAWANERLAHKYGTELLLADAQTLFQILADLDEKVKLFLKVTEGVQRVYKRAPLRKTFSIAQRDYPWSEFGSPLGVLTWSGGVQTESRACLYYTAHPPELSKFWTRVAQLCDSYNLRLDAGIVWDAIPYTFVVDWFINISDWLHNNMALNWFNLELKYVAFCTSFKATYNEQLVWYRGLWPGGPLDGFNYSAETLLTRITTVYRRSLGEIPEIGQAELVANQGPWKLSRAINALALASQKAHIPARKLAKSFYGYVD